jgi:hypothetical protein
MPRFYFDVRVGNEPTVVDFEGLDLVDTDAVHSKLIETATALARFEPHPPSRPLTVVVAVRNDVVARPIMRGTLVLRVAQEEAVAA